MMDTEQLNLIVDRIVNAIDTQIEELEQLRLSNRNSLKAIEQSLDGIARSVSELG